MGKNLNKAIQEYNSVVKSGDVVNIANHPPITKITSYIGCYGIRKAQKSVFKNPIQIYNNISIDPTDDTHSMIHFDKKDIQKLIIDNNTVLQEDKNKILKIWEKNNWAKVFSVEPPVATFVSIEDFILDDITVYRCSIKEFNERDIELLLKGVLPIIGTKYDFGQLINILICQELGYPYDEKVKWFDLSGKKKVCSVGVAVGYQFMRKQLELQGVNLPRLFSKLNEDKWEKDFIEKFNKDGAHWNVENTYPCMFGLTMSHFNSEFYPVLRMRDGEVLYKES